MKCLKCWKIVILRGSDGFFKNGEVVGVREEVAVVEHIYPSLPISDDFCNKSLFDNLAGRCRRDRHSAVLQVIFHAFPCQLKSVFQSLCVSLLLQWRELLLTICKSFLQKTKSPIKIFKALPPADIWIHKRGCFLDRIVRIVEAIF